MSLYNLSEAWVQEAQCRGIALVAGHVEEFFPPEHDGRSVATKTALHHALSMCDRCKVQGSCLDYALRNNIIDGIWGGKTPSQRRQIKRKWGRDRSFRDEIEDLIASAI